MGRLYTVQFTNVAISATQDLFQISATANMAFAVHFIELGQKTLTTWEAKDVTIKRLPATVTVTGGTAATPQKLNNGDSAATVTATTNNTTATTTSGTASTLFARDWEFLNGFFWMPNPEARPIIAPSQALVVNLGTAPSGSMTASGEIVIEELF